MNKIVFFIIVILFPFASSNAHEIDQAHISVYGNAEMEVVPNLMHWTVNVTNKGTNLQSVSTQHTQLVKKAINIISSAGVKKNKIQTNNMQFGENWVYKNQSRLKEGYTASTKINFELTSLEKYEALWLALAKMP